MTAFLRLQTFAMSILLAACLFLASSPAHASKATTVCEPYQSAALPYQYATCTKLVDSSSIRNLDALRYTIRIQIANLGRLEDPSCAIAGIVPDDRCISCRNPEWIKQGVQNSCSFVLNDLTELWTEDPQPGRTTAYFVDLCAADFKNVVTKFYVNGGTDPIGIDDPTRNSSLIGAFLAEGLVRGDFFTGHPEAYVGIRSRHNGQIPVVRMIGINSSNDTSEFDKPFHVTPFKTSLGCSAVNEKIVPIMYRYTARGSSLFMKYGGRKFEQLSSSCVND